MKRKNIFLTGEKGCGKTTAIKKYLSSVSCGTGGFVTMKVQDGPERGTWLYLMKGYDDEPSGENALCPLEEGKSVPEETVKRFDELGVSALTGAEENDLIIMDELGPREEKASLFHRAVMRCLDSDTPVLGVIQMAESGFLDKIRRRSDTLVLTVTEDNRGSIPSVISREFSL